MLRSVVAGLLAATASHALALDVTLCAQPYTNTALPGPNGTTVSVPMWGYSVGDSLGNCGAPSSPGPMITVPANTTELKIKLINKLTVPTSIVLAGQALPSDGGPPVRAADVVGDACAEPTTDAVCRVRSFTGEVAPGGTRTYTFAAPKPGSYLYQSGTHPQVQVQMGLSGLARVYPAGDPGFDADTAVVLSEIDADMHRRIDATLGSSALATQQTWKSGGNSTLKYAPGYFLINGQVFDGIDANGVAKTDLAVSSANGARVALRIANAGLQSRSLMLNSGTWKLLNEDGYPYRAPREQATVLVPAGKTTDAVVIASVPAGGATNRSLAIFDRRGGTDNADGTALGGQVARLALAAPLGPTLQAIAAQVVNEGSSLSLPVVGSNITTYSLTNAPAGMTINAASGLISWTPVASPPIDTTTYNVTVSGSDGATSVSQVFAARINHRPVMATGPAPITVVHGSVTIPAATLLAAATDPDTALYGDMLKAVVTTPPPAASGAAIANADGSVTFTGPQPAAVASTVSFSYVASDPRGLSSAPQVPVSLTVLPNRAPIAVNDGAVTPAGAGTPIWTITVNKSLLNPAIGSILLTPPAAFQFANTVLTANDSDPDAPAGSINPASLAIVPITGTVTARQVNLATGADLPAPTGLGNAESRVSVAAGVLTFTPRTSSFGLQVPANAFGLYRFQYTVNDDQGKVSNTAVAYVRVQLAP